MVSLVYGCLECVEKKGEAEEYVRKFNIQVRGGNRSAVKKWDSPSEEYGTFGRLFCAYCGKVWLLDNCDEKEAQHRRKLLEGEIKSIEIVNELHERLKELGFDEEVIIESSEKYLVLFPVGEQLDWRETPKVWQKKNVQYCPIPKEVLVGLWGWVSVRGKNLIDGDGVEIAGREIRFSDGVERTMRDIKGDWVTVPGGTVGRLVKVKEKNVIIEVEQLLRIEFPVSELGTLCVGQEI